MRISIIIVNYNSGTFLKGCLKSIDSFIKVPYEVIVVDNMSTDKSVELCRDYWSKNNFKIIKLNENAGFAKANNVGAQYAQGEILHFLNPDTELPESMNDDYNYCFSYPDSIYVNNLENPDGTFVKSKNIIPLLGNFLNRLFTPKKVAYWYTGASVIISKVNFEKIGKWNESFFMYCEDMDFFYKANMNKLKTYFLSSTIMHIGGGSSSKVWSNLKREEIVQTSFKKFFVLNKKRLQYPIVNIILVTRMFFINSQYAKTLVQALININFKK